MGGIVGSVAVSVLSNLLHNRKSLASAIFGIICILGLWGLAIQLPIHDTLYAHSSGDSSSVSILHYSSTTSQPSEHPTEVTLSLATDAHLKNLGTCLHPSPFTLNEQCKALDTGNIQHPLEQCKYLILHAVYVLFPQAGSSTLSASRFMATKSSQLLTFLRRFVHIDRFFPMRLALFFIGFGVNGPKTLVILELVELVPKQMCGTFTGVAGFFGQIGASYAGNFIAHTMIQEGWSSYVALLAVGSVVMTLCLTVSALIGGKLD